MLPSYIFDYFSVNCLLAQKKKKSFQLVVDVWKGINIIVIESIWGKIDKNGQPLIIM